MIYFRSLLSKRFPEIHVFLFEIVVPLITDARQNLETFEIKTKTEKRKKKNMIVFPNIVSVIGRHLKARLCLPSKQLMLTNVFK